MKFLTGGFARILYAIPFVVFGINHFINASAMQGIIPSFLPVKIFWVYLTGVTLIAAGVAIITKIHIKLAALLLALQIALFILFIHLPMVFKAATRDMAMISLLKDISLAAGALIISGMASKK